MEYRKITNIEDLNRALDEEHNDFVMTNGLLRSSKWITYGERDGEYEILNLIDDTYDFLTEDQLMNESNIGQAMKNGAFFCEIDD